MPVFSCLTGIHSKIRLYEVFMDRAKTFCGGFGESSLVLLLSSIDRLLVFAFAIFILHYVFRLASHLVYQLKNNQILWNRCLRDCLIWIYCLTFVLKVSKTAEQLTVSLQWQSSMAKIRVRQIRQYQNEDKKLMTDSQLFSGWTIRTRLKSGLDNRNVKNVMSGFKIRTEIFCLYLVFSESDNFGYLGWTNFCQYLVNDFH